MVYSQIARKSYCLKLYMSPETRDMSPTFLVKSPENLPYILKSSLRLFRVIESLKQAYITHLKCLIRFIKA